MAESKEQDALLKRINELAHKNKEEGLTEEETKESGCVVFTIKVLQKIKK